MTAQAILGTAQPDWLVQAPQREMWVAGGTHDETAYQIHNSDEDNDTQFNLRSAKQKTTVLRRPLPAWARYPAGVVTQLAINGMDVPPFNIVLLGDEPAGPRYDFGTGLVVAALCYELVEQTYTPDTLMQVVERVRREYVS